MIRTTVRVEDDIFKEARKKAIDERIAFADIVNDALRLYLTETKKEKRKEATVKVYRMGAVKGSLARRDLYGNI